MTDISFPKLGINTKVSEIAFSIGEKDIYWYALIILTGFFAGVIIALTGCEKRGLKKDHIWDIGLIGIVAGILGARIYYVLFSLDEFRGDWLSVFMIWEGGLAIYGGIIAAIISTSVYCKIKKLNLWNTFDVCCIGLLLGQSIGRWGNFVNCEVYGRVTDSLFGMSIAGDSPVHPLFLYESLWSLAGVILIALFRDKKTKSGQVICFYLFWYSTGRLFLEGMRDTEYILYLIPDKLAISQVVAGLFIATSIAMFIYITKSKKQCFNKVEPITEPAPEQTEEVAE